MIPQKRHWTPPPFRQKIRNALLSYYLTPILLILALTFVFLYLGAQRILDDEFGKRLKAIAVSSSLQVRPIHIAALGLYDSESQTYKTLQERLLDIQKKNDIERIYVFNERNRSLLDTNPKTRPGSLYERNLIYLPEINEAKKGKVALTTLFQGDDGAYYKSAIAPIQSSDGNVLAFIRVDGNATFFQNLHKIARQLGIILLLSIVVIIVVSLILSQKIVTPIRLLVENAERIGEGNLHDSIQLNSRNELGFLGYAFDQMRRNIVHRDEEMKMMLQGIAHEVRNPLGGMELFIGLLDEQVHTKEQKEAVRRIKNELRVLKALVEDFLDFARGPVLSLEKVQLFDFVEEILFSFAYLFDEKKIRVENQIPKTSSLSIDADQFRRVFLNLIQNSVQAMPNGGVLTFNGTMNPTEDSFQIEISDTGIGISADQLEKVFDPFFTTKEKGSGLGLSFVRKIVNAHGGKVEILSEVGKGTSIFIVLPLS